MAAHLLTGVLIGLLIAMPIGPIDILCIRRTLLWGPKSGFITGIGAALADAIYGACAVGIATLTGALISYRLLLQAAGGIFLCGIGIKTLRINEIGKSEESLGKRQFFATMTTFFLALMSPMTVLSIAGAYAAFGIGLGQNFEAGLILALGVFIGSSLWWLILSCLTALFKNRLSVRNIHLINRFSGAVLFCSGLLAIGFSLLHFSNEEVLSLAERPNLIMSTFKIFLAG